MEVEHDRESWPPSCPKSSGPSFPCPSVWLSVQPHQHGMKDESTFASSGLFPEGLANIVREGGSTKLQVQTMKHLSDDPKGHEGRPHAAS